MASQVEHRATQSAAALGKMNSLIHIFGEDLAQSGLLSDRPGLESHLRHVLAACQSLVEQQHPHLAADEGLSQQRMSSGSGSGSSPPSDATRAEPPSRPIPTLQPDPALPSVPALRTMLQPQLSSAALATINLDEFPMPLGPRSPLLFDDLEEDAAVDVSVFARHVRRACCYHAYFALRDPSISYADLRPKFRFLFSMHTRDTLIAYYHEAALYADLEPARMDRWQGIPFLDVGGAGSHYATKPGASPSSSRLGYSSSNASGDSFGNASQQRDEPETNGKESDRVSHAWFDIHDLEGYLLEKEIKLVANLTTERQARASAERPIFNPSKLIRSMLRHARCLFLGLDKLTYPVLVGTCTCLGRSPGWRVANIDNCLEQALVAT